MTPEEILMSEAIAQARKGIYNNEGGPFGCIVVKNGQVIGRGNNKVTSTNDPTAHAEVVAIREACNYLGTFQLDDCEIYSSCEPCPMCLGAIYWSRAKIIYYANNREDAAKIGFDDSMIYDEFARKPEERKIPIVCLGREEALKLFEEWQAKPDKIQY